MASSPADSPLSGRLGCRTLIDDKPLKNETVFLNLSRRSLAGKEQWTLEKAVRSVFEVCLDYIMNHHQLKMDQIKYRIQDTGDEFLAIISSKSKNKQLQSSDTLGHVYFNRSMGMLEITINDAKLSRRALETGLLTNTDGFDAVGRFGKHGHIEQLSVCEAGHQIEILASDFKWRYNIGNAAAKDEDGFYCFISKNLATDASHTSKVKKTLQTPTTRPERDASIRIGDVFPGRVNLKEKKLTQLNFNQIKKQLLKLNNPTKLFGSPYGTILVDDHLCGFIYVKGLLVSSGNQQTDPGYEGRKLKWGYNFFNSFVGGDGYPALILKKLVKLRTLLIDNVIHHGKDGSAPILQGYIDMLRDPESKFGDADGAENYAPKRTASSIWSVLKSEALEQNLFYYDSPVGPQVDQIRKGLEKEPKLVSSRLLKVLVKYNLATTPYQQMVKRHTAAKDSDKEVTPYFSSLKRLLSAALAADPCMSDYKMKWKSEKDTLLHCWISANRPLIIINDRFGDFQGGHKLFPCSFSRGHPEAVDTSIFSCDHIIAQLYSMFLYSVRSIRREQKLGPVYSDVALLLKTAELTERLSQMPRHVQSKTGSAQEIVVTWLSKDSCMASELHGLKYECRITLHRESTCAGKRSDLLGYATSQEEPASGQYDADCGCPEQLVYLNDRQATFSRLSDAEKYFPLVAHTEFQAFYGEPPESISPNAPDPENVHAHDPVAPTQSSSISASLPSQMNDRITLGKESNTPQLKDKDHLQTTSHAEDDHESRSARRRRPNESTQQSSNEITSGGLSMQIAQTKTRRLMEPGSIHSSQSQLEDFIALIEDQKKALVVKLEANLGSGGLEARNAALQANNQDLMERLASISNELDNLKDETRAAQTQVQNLRRENEVLEKEHGNFLAAVEHVLQGSQDAPGSSNTQDDHPDAVVNSLKETSGIVKEAVSHSESVTCELVEKITPQHRAILDDVRGLKADHAAAYETIASMSTNLANLAKSAFKPKPKTVAPPTSFKRQRLDDSTESPPQPTSKRAKLTEGLENN